MFRSQVITAAVAMTGGLLVSSAALAAANQIVSGETALRLAPAATVLLDAKGHFLNIANHAAPPVAQPVSQARPNLIAFEPAQGVRLELANGRNWESYGDLLPSQAGFTSTYLASTTVYAAASFELTDNLSFRIGQSRSGLGSFAFQADPLSHEMMERLGAATEANIATASLTWNFANWGSFDVTASNGNGNAALLGVMSGALGTGAVADTLSLGISARVGFGEGWVTTIAYSGGVTQLDLSRSGLTMATPDPVRSQGFGLSLAKEGLFGADAIGISVSRPLQVYNGALGSALANSQARESDVELGYVTTFLDGTVALQANAAYQVNAAGTNGQNAVAGVARARVKF